MVLFSLQLCLLLGTVSSLTLLRPLHRICEICSNEGEMSGDSFGLKKLACRVFCKGHPGSQGLAPTWASMFIPWQMPRFNVSIFLEMDPALGTNETISSSSWTPATPTSFNEPSSTITAVASKQDTNMTQNNDTESTAAVSLDVTTPRDGNKTETG